MPYIADIVVVCDAEPPDVTAIRQLASASGIDVWTDAGYLDEMSSEKGIVLKALADRSLAGFLVARVVPGATDRPEAELYNIAVEREFTRTGVGTALVTALIDRLASVGVRDIWLEVRESNAAARKFYEKHGFSAEITRPNFYVDPVENAVVMRLRMRETSDVSEL